MKLYDCFCFNDELDLLELRLMELGSVVDHFVLAEAPMTFTRKSKPLHYQENKARFAEWSDKIIHVVVDDIPDLPHPVPEHYQRNALARGWTMEPNDLVMIGDVDEIPFRDAVSTWKTYPADFASTVVMFLYYYAANLAAPMEWNGTVILPAKYMRNPESVRQSRHHFPKLRGMGAHFSWLGDSEAVSRKLDALDVEADAKLYGTPEMEKPDTRLARERVEAGLDLFGRGIVFDRIDPLPGVTHPCVISEWLAKHPEYAR